MDVLAFSFTVKSWVVSIEIIYNKRFKRATPTTLMYFYCTIYNSICL